VFISATGHTRSICPGPGQEAAVKATLEIVSAITG